MGGSGNDTYNFSGNWGTDTIEDWAGNDTIKVDGQTLTGVTQGHNTATSWVSRLAA